jgi:hypothetical protein
MTEIILPFFRIRNNFFYETEGVRAPTGYILKKKDLYMITEKENLNCVCGGGWGGGGVWTPAFGFGPPQGRHLGRGASYQIHEEGNQPSPT